MMNNYNSLGYRTSSVLNSQETEVVANAPNSSVKRRTTWLMSLTIMLMSLISFTSNAQTIIISPSVNDGGFENTTSSWTIINGTQTNKWQISNNATSGYSPTKCAYVSNSASAPYSQNYSLTNTSTVFFYQDVTFPAGETSINLSSSIYQI
mgnify:CR=1 FL=1